MAPESHSPSSAPVSGCGAAGRHRDLLEIVHAAELEPAAQDPASGSPVSRASLQAGLANAQARNTRLTARIQQLGSDCRRPWELRRGRSPGSEPQRTSTSSSGRSRGWSSKTSNGPPRWRRPDPISMPRGGQPGPDQSSQPARLRRSAGTASWIRPARGMRPRAPTASAQNRRGKAATRSIPPIPRPR